jgi:hypothetical protein
MCYLVKVGKGLIIYRKQLPLQQTTGKMGIQGAEEWNVHACPITNYTFLHSSPVEQRSSSPESAGNERKSFS